MLRIVNLEEIENILSRITSIVDLQEQRDTGFVHEVKRWLKQLEKVLDNNRILAAGNIAALRGVLISAERGILPTELEIHGRYTVRKIREATASNILKQAGDIVSSAIRKDNERIAEATRILRQLVALAKTKGLLHEPLTSENYTERLKALWRTLASDPDISPGTTNVEGLVGPNDALIILDRTITSDLSAK